MKHLEPEHYMAGITILLIVFVTYSAIITTGKRREIDADIASGKYKKTNMFIVQKNKEYTVYINNKEKK